VTIDGAVHGKLFFEEDVVQLASSALGAPQKIYRQFAEFRRGTDVLCCADV